MEILLGKGVLSWPACERRSARYGTVMLMQEGTNSFTKEERPVTLETKPEPGQRVKLFVVVTKSRKSTHLGDLFLGISPSTPSIGERIDLGEGSLFYEDFRGYTLVGLRPDDGRKSDWLDPKKLYQAHEQSVELYCDMRGE